MLAPEINPAPAGFIWARHLTLPWHLIHLPANGEFPNATDFPVLCGNPLGKEHGAGTMIPLAVATSANQHACEDCLAAYKAIKPSEQS